MKKTVLITGASSGIGQAIAIWFQWKGWNVAATMRQPEKDTELKDLENLKCFQLDVNDEPSIRRAFDDTIKTFGAIDVIVNNAGYGLVGAFEASSAEQIKKQFDTNVFGVMNMTRLILPYFRERKEGIIINIASTGGRMTWPISSLYNSTKWAIEGFSESLQFELKPFGIRVKIIEPGAIKTDFYGRSQDFAEQPGLSAYNAYVNLVMPNLQKAGAEAPGPEVVAEKVYRAATDGSWRLRYQAGKGAGAFMFLRRIMPTSWFNAVVRMVTEKKEDRLKPYRASE